MAAASNLRLWLEPEELALVVARTEWRRRVDYALSERLGLELLAELARDEQEAA